MQNNTVPELAFYRIGKVVDLVGMSKSKIYAQIKDGRFPKPRKNGNDSIWINTEIYEWQRKMMELWDKELDDLV